MDNGLVLVESDVNHFSLTMVLILVVVDNGLVLALRQVSMGAAAVLILVVVDNGLVPMDATIDELENLVLILVVVDNGLVLDLIRHY